VDAVSGAKVNVPVPATVALAIRFTVSALMSRSPLLPPKVDELIRRNPTLLPVAVPVSVIAPLVEVIEPNNSIAELDVVEAPAVPVIVMSPEPLLTVPLPWKCTPLPAVIVPLPTPIMLSAPLSVLIVVPASSIRTPSLSFVPAPPVPSMVIVPIPLAVITLPSSMYTP